MSYIEMPSAKVIDMAEAMLARIQESKDYQKQAAIDDLRKEYEESWLNRFFGRKTPSDEALWEELSYGWAHSFVNSYCLIQKNKLEDIIRAAGEADTINISVEDLGLM